jgi:hypothetical protein
MVMRSDNLAPITNAIIFDVGGLARDTSKSDGTFRLVYQLLSQTKTRIIGSRAGFGNDTASVTLNPGVDTTITLSLKADSSSPSGAVSTGKAANIVLVTSSTDNISIRGTGSNETAVLQFEVRDSLGIPIAGVNKLTVNFSILGGPGGGEYVFPVTSETDPLTGRVATRVSSGTKAGVLQVYATATIAGTPPLTIKSSPIKITISGGLPDDSHFSISRKPLNIAGGLYDNLRAQVMVIVGDKEGNPVQQGTAVSFTTTGGVIQPNASTDKDGIAQVDLISANPRPSNSVAIVTAKTIGDSGKIIQKSTTVLFSGPTRILTPSTTITIPDSGVASFQYRVQDPNGFPLAGGTSISLTVDGPGSGELVLSGDVTKTLEDSNDPNSTLFNVTVQDKALHGPSGAVNFKITVTSQNGNASATFPGVVLKDTSSVPPVLISGKSGYTSSITLVAISSPEVSVRGTGANETARVTFVAKDSVGNTVDVLHRAGVTFTIMPFSGLGGGEFVFPSFDSTDANGQVSTTFNAGTKSGVLQVMASAISRGRTITSSPVRVTISQGLPDASHFTANLTPTTIVSWPTSAGVPVDTVKVQVGDRYGNPVQANTALYFSTSAGVIQPRALTDDNGLAGVVMYGGNPLPVGDSVQVTAQTVGEGGVAIVRTLTLRITSSTGSFTSGFASSLTLKSNVTNQLSVRGTGATEATTLTFVARDSVGNLLDPKRRLLVNFSISPTNGLGGGEFLSPTSGYTDANGEVTTTFNSGVKSGVVQIVATANVQGQTISVASGRITISGGFPDPTKITAFLSRVNMPGLAKTGPIGTLSVQVGDKFGNPVQVGTAVSFSSNGGLIQPFAQTDVNGLATVTLQGGKPFPNDPTAGGPGYGTITLQTVGEAGAAISVPITFLFSGAPIVTLQNVPNDTIKIFDASNYDVDYTVADVNGNPISGGHNVSVSISGAAAASISLSGDINFSTPDTKDKVNFTHYRFRATDNTPNGGIYGEVVFTITVTGEAGTFVRKFYGNLQPPQVANTVPPTARQPSQIAFLGITNTDIYVAGVGNTENSVITYEVRDSLGIPIDKTRRVYATFGLQFFPNNYVGGGLPPQIIPSADSTDDSGKLRTAIVSGTQAGVVQIVARVLLPGGGVVVSQPVKVTIHAGFADQRHFSINPSRYVFPGFEATGVFPYFNQVPFTVVVGDTFSNPVQSGTAVYFNSSAGVMQTGTTGSLASYTNQTGIATATLYCVNPVPNVSPYDYVPGPADPFYAQMGGGSPAGLRIGYSWIWAQTQGQGGRKVIDSVLVVWNKAPIVVTGLPSSTVDIFTSPNSLSAPISITVKDINGNPLCDGTVISASCIFTTNVPGVTFGVVGDISSAQAFVMPAAGFARFPGPGSTDFTFQVADLSTSPALGQHLTVQITISSPGLAAVVLSFPAVVVP